MSNFVHCRYTLMTDINKKKIKTSLTIQMPICFDTTLLQLKKITIEGNNEFNQPIIRADNPSTDCRGRSDRRSIRYKNGYKIPENAAVFRPRTVNIECRAMIVMHRQRDEQKRSANNCGLKINANYEKYRFSIDIKIMYRLSLPRK